MTDTADCIKTANGLKTVGTLSAWCGWNGVRDATTVLRVSDPRKKNNVDDEGDLT